MRVTRNNQPVHIRLKCSSWVMRDSEFADLLACFRDNISRCKLYYDNHLLLLYRRIPDKLDARRYNA